MSSHELQADDRSKTESGIAKTSSKKLALNSGDIRDLYEAARALGGLGGAPYLNRLFDAEAALKSGFLHRVQEILSKTRNEFQKAHTRLLRFRPKEGGGKKSREDERLDSKRQHVEDLLARFDQYVEAAERMAEAAGRAPREPDATAPPHGAKGRIPLPAGLAEALQSEQTTDAQFAVVSRHFDWRAAVSTGDIAPDSLFFLRTRTRGYLLRTSPEPLGDVVRLTDACTGKEVKPQPVHGLLEQGRKEKFFALTRRKKANEPKEQTTDSSSDTASPDPLEAQNTLLDRQLFNVLMMAVRQSGLNISADLIVRVRDNEFRKGDYHDAFEKLNQLSTRFEMAAARRTEELRRHDQWLSSGQSGLSMREVEEAKLRNAQERTRIEHASHRFGLVVEPLRILARES